MIHDSNLSVNIVNLKIKPIKFMKMKQCEIQTYFDIFILRKLDLISKFPLRVLFTLEKPVHENI